jgi:hypothetical protein
MSTRHHARWLAMLGIGGLTVGWIVLMARLLGFRSAFFALNLHFALMGAADLASRILAPRLQGRRFRVSPWEVALYRKLGVPGFMRILRRIGWTAAVRQPGMFDGTRGTLASYERATRVGETNHAGILLIVLVPLGWALARGWLDAAFWIGSQSVLFHVYPIFLQRYQRARLTALLERTRAA